MQARLIKNIDSLWWDSEIEACKNSLIYAKSWYLDAISPGWSALVFGDNEAFMPLPRKSKFGLLPIILQPLFCQQLGVFYKDEMPDFNLALPALNRSIRTVLNLNSHHKGQGEKKTNYILDISKPYEELKGAYNKDAKKNLKKEILIDWLEPAFSKSKFRQLVKVYKSQYGEKENFDEKKEELLQNVLFAAHRNKSLLFFELKDSDDMLLFNAAILKDEKRLYYLFGAPTVTGRTQNITHYFIDGLIRRYAGQNYILDFEGSMIPGVAQFYKKWGSKKEIYWVYKSKWL